MAAPLTYIEVDLEAIAHNVRAIKRHVGPRVALMAVVKANAYGHGALEVARTALQHGASRLAVARAAEGVHLREAGITDPILVMGYTLIHDIEEAVAHHLTLTVNDMASAETVSALAGRLGRAVPIHVKIDTGMGRFGLLPDEVLPFVDRLAALPGVWVEGLFTHFAVADLADKEYTRHQFRVFQRVRAQLEAANHRIPICHVANSAATLDLLEMHLDAVRAGIAIYGLRPSSEVDPAVPLRPALSLKSHVTRVRTLPAGASISYGRTYVTPRAMPVALIPVGYGDGYHRLISNRGAALINGQRAPIVGRVCMDQLVVDVSQTGPVAVNSEAVLIGRQGESCITAEEVATWAETINYEVTTALLPRVPRLYLGVAT
ncbi:MAG: alanine racemase [Chloroflexota bacterium]|jgi:alanine racemase